MFILPWLSLVLLISMPTGFAEDINPVKLAADTATEEKELERISQQHGVQHAYEYLKEKWQRDQIGGHPLAHVVGRLAYEQLGDKGFGICDSNFGFGCYHGLVETLIKQQGSPGIEAARRGCNSLAPRGQVVSCLHGIGHGIMHSKGEVNSAVSTCQGFPQDDRLPCFDGVFMEYYTAIIAGQRSEAAGNKPWHFCSSVPKEAQSQCVRNQTIYILFRKPEDYRSVVSSCMALASEMQPSCTHSFGVMATRHSQGNTHKIVEMCSAFPRASTQRDCIIAGAQEFVFQNQSLQSAHTLCSSLSNSYRESCEATISGSMANYGRK